MTKWFSYKLSNLELWCLLTSYRKSYKEPIIDPLKSKMAILTPKCKNAVFSKTKYYPNRTTLSRKMTSCRFSRRQISAILDFRDPIALNLLHPAIRHDHDIDFARWLHPAIWHVALESWQWIHQVAAPCSVAGVWGMTCHGIRPRRRISAILDFRGPIAVNLELLDP